MRNIIDDVMKRLTDHYGPYPHAGGEKAYAESLEKIFADHDEDKVDDVVGTLIAQFVRSDLERWPNVGRFTRVLDGKSSVKKTNSQVFNAIVDDDFRSTINASANRAKAWAVTEIAFSAVGQAAIWDGWVKELKNHAWQVFRSREIANRPPPKIEEIAASVPMAARKAQPWPRADALIALGQEHSALIDSILATEDA